jgi:hypothetical protein
MNRKKELIEKIEKGQIDLKKWDNKIRDLWNEGDSNRFFKEKDIEKCIRTDLPPDTIQIQLDEFKPRKGILTRYGAKLLQEGAKFYARMSIKNFQEELLGEPLPMTQEIPHSEAPRRRGYNGASHMDSGYFYAPFIPISSTPVVLDPIRSEERIETNELREPMFRGILPSYRPPEKERVDWIKEGF